MVRDYKVLPQLPHIVQRSCTEEDKDQVGRKSERVIAAPMRGAGRRAQRSVPCVEGSQLSYSGFST